MKENNYHIVLQFCQHTLDQLINPYVHVGKGCLFNQVEEKYLDQNKCPVCLEQNANLKQDSDILAQLDQKNEKQLIYDKGKKAIFYMKRKQYTFDNISNSQQIKQLQQLKYKTWIKEITLQQIQEISSQRNNNYIQYLKHLPESDKIPILFGVINNKLILFYHIYKLKVEFSLYDISNSKIRQKLQQNTHGVLQQIVFFENNLYFLYFKQNTNITSIFKGDFQQIFTYQNSQNNMEAQFQIVQLVNFRLEGPAILIQVGEKDLIMIGTKKCFSITQQNNQFYGIQLETLKENSLYHFFNNNQLLLLNQDQDDKKTQINYFCYDLLKPNPQQIPQINNIKLKPFICNNFQDNYLIFGDKMVTYNTSELQNEKCQINSFCSWQPSQQRIDPINQSANIINHQSYMQTVKIISTQKHINSISCQLIGLRLKNKNGQDEEKDIFPALLVYNGQTQSFEVELV